MAKRGKGDGGNPPFAPDEILIRDEFARQFEERGRGKQVGITGLLPAVLRDPRRFAEESRARRVAYTQIAAHPKVKTALLMAERLRYVALRVDAVLTFRGNPEATTDRALELVLAPLLRELSELCAPYEGTPQRQRDKLIDLVQWSATMLAQRGYAEKDWKHVVSTLRFELMSVLPGVGERPSDDDIRRSVTVFLPERHRPEWTEPLAKWDQLALLARRGRLGNPPPETVRTEYTKHRSSRRKQEEAEEEELRTVPLGNKVDDAGLTGAARERAMKKIMAIEARALVNLRAKPPKP